MSQRNDYNYSNFENYNDGFNNREYRRRPPQNRQTASNRPVYNVNRNNRRRPSRRNKKRTRNRIIIVGSFILIIALLIALFSVMFKGCSNDRIKTSANVSKETKSTGATTASGASANDSQSTSSAGGLLSPTTFVTPNIADNIDETGFNSFGVYIWNGAAYELFGSDDDKAKTYANTINGFADKFSSDVTIYNMVIPNHTEVGLPQRLKNGEAKSTSQAENIKSIYANLSDRVTPINAYNLIAEHNNEYIFFNSDHHWTGLGAYYAYSAFAQTTKQKVLDLKSCEEAAVEGFTGSFSSYSDSIKSDTVHYWKLPYNVSMDVYYSYDTFDTYNSPYYEYAEAGTSTYGVFIIGDNQDYGLTVLRSESEDATEGKKIAVVKESFGNAFVPYLTNNYQEVHTIDFRYFSQNLPDYCEANGIDEVLFINGIMSANTQIQLDSMSTLF